jgi:hypothetical protein
LVVAFYCRKRRANSSGSGFEFEMRAGETASVGSWELPTGSGDGKSQRATVKSMLNESANK